MEKVRTKVTEITEDLVKYRTTEQNQEEIQECLSYIENYFTDELEVERFEKEGKKSIVVSNDDGRKPKILLHGHVDVVDAPEEMFRPEIEENEMFGRGTGDMKSGLACLMVLMEEIAQNDQDVSVALMVVSDEEVGGFNGAKYLLEEVGYEPEFAISAEPNNMDGYLDIVAKQKGILQIDLKTEGKNAHGSRPWKGENAAEKLIEIYREEVKPLFSDFSDKTWDTTLNLGVLESGEAPNQVPNKATARLDIRYSGEYMPEEILEDLNSIPSVEVEVNISEPMMDNDFENRFIQSLKESAEEVVEECEIRKKEPGSDMRFFTERNIPAVVFGPEAYNSHGPDEYVNLESVEDYYRILKKFVEKEA